MNVTRQTKNRLLAALAAAFALLIFVRQVKSFEDLPTRDWIWLAAAIVVAILNAPPVRQPVSATLRHAALFLLCGAALGFTAGDVLKDPAGSVLEWIWLGGAIVVVLVH
ncbi:MAG: hypothetical protein AAF657_08290 [Acidobacteriota bacterium]